MSEDRLITMLHRVWRKIEPEIQAKTLKSDFSNTSKQQIVADMCSFSLLSEDKEAFIIFRQLPILEQEKILQNAF